MTDESASPETSMPLTGHLSELRNRLLWVVGTVLGMFVITYYFSAQLLDVAQRPVAGMKLVFLSPTEAFFAHLKVSFFAALYFSLPFIFFHIWRFCAPGLLSNEKRHAFPFVVASTICFTVGALFCYYLILPYGLSFLLSFATDSLVAQISIGFYISFIFKLILVFGLVFEIPLVTLLLVKIGVVTPEFLTSNRSYIIVGSFVVAAALTPPDIVTQLLLAGPLIVLYEISVVIAKVMTKRKKKAEAEAEAEDDSA